MNKSVMLALGLLILGGCAQSPSTFIIAPSQALVPTGAQSTSSITLKVIDNRRAKHILEINRSGDPAQYVNSTGQGDIVLLDSLQQRFAEQGYVVSNNGANAITVIIDNMLITVAQQTFSYATKTQVTLTINVESKEQTSNNSSNKKLSKTFRSAASSNGPLVADIAVLESDFNILLGKLLKNISQDQQIQQYIK
ncbi:MAG: hypothetical protein HRU25_08885 [Psychrobium sp.]|nr:hypothetical protein [Psychrobium sp.]